MCTHNSVWCYCWGDIMTARLTMGSHNTSKERSYEIKV